MPKPRARRADRLIDLSARAVLGALCLLPYRWRVPAMGWLTAYVVAPLAGWRRRIDENLAYAVPDLPAAERRRLVRRVPENVGRTLIEIYSGPELHRHVGAAPIEGPGAAVLDAAARAGTPVVAVTGHFGNFVAPRVAMLARGHALGGLYRPMRNVHFNRHYAAALTAIGGPMFPSTREGLGKLLRHLREGGMVGVLVDVHANDGAELTFFGRRAPTALSAADLALRYDAPLVPLYGIRQPDGMSFRVVAEAPIPHSDPETMTQALNDSLEAQVRAHMDQWFWIHRRWKPERQRARAAANTGP